MRCANVRACTSAPPTRRAYALPVEIIDNSVDEALAGFCNDIVVTLHTDGSVEVADNGRGIPVDKEPKTGLSGVEVVLTKLHAGAKFGNSSYNAVGACTAWAPPWSMP